MEQWKDIQGFEGLYKVSSFGRVVRYARTYFCCCNKHLPENDIKGDLCRGYHRVTLYSNKSKKRIFVHRLVAETFMPNDENKPEIDHIDGNPLNNNISNLRWCNHKENLNNPITRKRKSEATKRFYERSKKNDLYCITRISKR